MMRQFIISEIQINSILDHLQNESFKMVFPIHQLLKNLPVAPEIKEREIKLDQNEDRKPLIDMPKIKPVKTKKRRK